MTNNQPLAIQFADLREFSALTAERGDEEAYRLVRSFVDLVESRVSGHGGRLLKTYGDGVMTSFDDAIRAVECSIETQDALCEEFNDDDAGTLSAGIGLTWGTAIQTGDDLFGTSVNLAKRIADVAKGGQIVVSSTLAGHADLAASGRSYRDLGERSLKGLGDQRLYEVVWRREVATLETLRDDMDLILTDDRKLVIQFAKPVLDELEEVQEKLATLGDGVGGLEGRIKRAVGKRMARKLPGMMDWVAARSGMGIEHSLADIEAKTEDGQLVLYIKGRKRVTVANNNADPAAVDRFLQHLQALKRSAGLSA